MINPFQSRAVDPGHSAPHHLRQGYGSQCEQHQWTLSGERYGSYSGSMTDTIPSSLTWPTTACPSRQSTSSPSVSHSKWHRTVCEWTQSGEVWEKTESHHLFAVPASPWPTFTNVRAKTTRPMPRWDSPPPPFTIINPFSSLRRARLLTRSDVPESPMRYTVIHFQSFYTVILRWPRLFSSLRDPIRPSPQAICSELMEGEESCILDKIR